MVLTVKQIEAAKFGTQKERLSDGTGLYLRLHASGKKVFQMQVARSSSERPRVWVSLGDFPGTGLKEARDKAGWVRLQVARGWSAEQVRAALQTDDAAASVRPDAAEDRSRVPFPDVARTWSARKREGLKNGKHIQQNWNTIATYAFPALGHRPVGEIRTLEVVEALRPIWHAKHETARRTLGRISEVSNWPSWRTALP